MTTKDKVKVIVKALDSKKGKDIQVLQVEQLTTLTEYFVICTATSTTHVKALADEVEFQMKQKLSTIQTHEDGYSSANWIVLDYGFAFVHVFLPEAREFYGLEKLWKEGQPVELSEFIQEES